MRVGRTRRRPAVRSDPARPRHPRAPAVSGRLPWLVGLLACLPDPRGKYDPMGRATRVFAGPASRANNGRHGHSGWVPASGRGDDCMERVGWSQQKQRCSSIKFSEDRIRIVSLNPNKIIGSVQTHRVTRWVSSVLFMQQPFMPVQTMHETRSMHVGVHHEKECKTVLALQASKERALHSITYLWADSSHRPDSMHACP